MYKLPRFNFYKQPGKAIPEETEPEGEWEQHVTLPMQKPEYDSYLKSKSEMLNPGYDLNTTTYEYRSRGGLEHF